MINSSNSFRDIGYFTFAINNQTTDYLKIAYMQALSLKATNKINNYAVAVKRGTSVPTKYNLVFDHVIEFDKTNISPGSSFDNEHLAYELSPFEETIKLDSDIIFTSDISSYLDLYQRYDVMPTSTVVSYRGTKDIKGVYRQVFKNNNIPNTYSGFTYFKKSSLAKVFYLEVKNVMRDFYLNKFILKDCKYSHLPTDEAYGLALKNLNIYYLSDIISFVHMKPFVQDLNRSQITEIWTNHLKYYFDSKMQLFVENFKQTLPFHYQLKSFANQKNISKYEKYLGI